MEKKKKDDDTDEQKMLLQSQNLAYIRSKCVGEQKVRTVRGTEASTRVVSSGRESIVLCA